MTVLCKNCAHYRRDFPFIFSSRFAKCVSPNIIDINLVNGKKLVHIVLLKEKII